MLTYVMDGKTRCIPLTHPAKHNATAEACRATLLHFRHKHKADTAEEPRLCPRSSHVAAVKG
ncbi:hypothetical protein E2C01_050009 [Portunus trituberculatus]|uniref:Uncharacterized protein n=1 Tax=Portunus trituberculatus TaxID=210409 RepID=A0A5B7GEY1_PORTR|nr:hypothetical protein [Portunus trituberculatus]